MDLIAVALLLGIFKAWRDTIAHHNSIMVFNTRWFKSFWDDKKYHFGPFKVDAWHVFDNLIVLMIVYLASTSRENASFLQIAGLILIYWATFSLFYKKLLIKKKTTRKG